MNPDDGLTQATEPDSRAVRCLLCHRMRSADSSELAAPEWNQLPEVFLSDTYCDDCAVFYRQLMTYGDPGQGSGARDTPFPPVM